MSHPKEVYRIQFYTRKVAEYRKLPGWRKDGRHKRLMAYKKAMHKQLAAMNLS